MKTALAIIAVLISAQAHALLFCYDSQTDIGMEWIYGKVTYTDDLTGKQVANPGPNLVPDQYEFRYCYANGTELAYVQKNMPAMLNNAKPSVQDNYGTVYWTGDQALFIENNL